jgi:PadR family transcriptional regulator PadR
MGTRLPGEFEQVVLLTLARFDNDATGREVYEAIVSTTGRDVSVAAIHITLTRLADKGWAECHTSPPEPGQGGKPRRRYALAQEGAARLADQRGQLDRLWEQAQTHPLLDGGQG